MTTDFTLEDIRNVLNESIKEAVEASEARMKNYTDEQFNWLATQMMQGFARMDDKIEDLGIDLRREMRTGFEKMDRKLGFVEANHSARIGILEEKVL